jgi:hypothetical protein
MMAFFSRDIRAPQTYRAIMELEDAPDAKPYASCADLPPIEWLWKGWIANRLLNILAAPPGADRSNPNRCATRRANDGGVTRPHGGRHYWSRKKAYSYGQLRRLQAPDLDDKIDWAREVTQRALAKLGGRL